MGIHLSSSHPAGFIAHLPQQSKGKTINMSHFRNTDTMNSAQGEFHSRVKPSEPLTTKGVSITLPAHLHLKTDGDQQHAPGVKEVPGQAQTPDTQATTAASETLPGATSASVHQGLGHPGSGQTSQELHGTHKKERSGLTGVGANLTDPIHQNHHDRPYETGKTDKGATDYPTAEDQPPVSAEGVASERR